MNRTPIDRDTKLDIVDHINQDHKAELFAIIEGYDTTSKIIDVAIADIYQEGVLLSLSTETDTDIDVFFPFDIEGDIEEQIFYLAYSALVKQGKDFSYNRKQFFEVTDKQLITPNITRLTITSSTALPEAFAGYSYALLLKTLEKKPDIKQASQHKSKLRKYVDLLLLWGIKKLSKKNRQKVLGNMNKDVRAYTLRSAWKTTESEFFNQGYIDIFTHGDSAGSLWAQALNVGDVIASRSGAEDKHEHLHTGQSVLIADETAYPALAGILDNWQNDKPPQVIILSALETEQGYFSDGPSSRNSLPEDAQVHRIVCQPQEQAEHVIETLNVMSGVDNVWGAFENGSAKKVRHFLRNEYGLEGKQNRIRGYWRLR